MDDIKIIEIANFLYSSDDAHEVPFRVCLTFGMGGLDIDYEQFILLMKFLRDSELSTENCQKFLDEINHA
jgi:hypothetical protein